MVAPTKTCLHKNACAKAVKAQLAKIEVVAKEVVEVVVAKEVVEVVEEVVKVEEVVVKEAKAN